MSLSNLSAFLFDASQAWLDKSFLVCDGRDLTHSQFWKEVAGRTEAFRQRDVSVDDKVIVVTGRGADYWVDLASLWAIGAVAVPLAEDTVKDHIDLIIKKTQPRFQVGDLKFHETGLERLKTESTSASELSSLSFTELPDGQLANILFTSGSTGQPKGVPQTQASVLANARSSSEALNYSQEDRLVTAVPFRFVSMLSHFLVALLNGTTLICTEKKMFQGDFINFLKDSNATAFGGGPVLVKWIADAFEQDDSELNLRWVMSSGDHLGGEIIEKIRKCSPSTDIYVVYGLTELSGRFCVLPPENIDTHKDCVGRPISGLKLNVLNEKGESATPGQSGEIVASGEMVFRGYWKDDQGRSKFIDGQFVTGDVGYIDTEGYVYIQGRSDDVFKSGGVKVSIQPIVSALMATEAFVDVAVTAQEHSVIGKVPVALYVMKPGLEFSKGDILRSLRKSLPANFIPKSFYPVEKIPRTGSGKVVRSQLPELIPAEPL
jgi:long-chain acyl-CoA synthetase